MSDNMEIPIRMLNLDTQVYTREQIVNEFVRKFPRTKLENITKFIKIYNQNQSKYLNNNIKEIIIDCVKTE